MAVRKVTRACLWTLAFGMVMTMTIGLQPSFQPRIRRPRRYAVVSAQPAVLEQEKLKKQSATLQVGKGTEADLVHAGDYVIHYDRGICVYAGRFGDDADGAVLLRFADKTVAIEPDVASKALTLYRRGNESPEVEDGGSEEKTGYDQVRPELRGDAMGTASVKTGGSGPKLSTIKSPRAWRRFRNRGAEAARDHARQLVATSAARRQRERIPCQALNASVLHYLDKGLGFALTSGQLQCVEDVFEDMCRRRTPMDRLVFGDVGFGKTEVALRAIALAIANQRQAALIAPTSILAVQHYNTIKRRLNTNETKVELLLGGYTFRERQRILKAIASGECSVVVGTHAVLNDKVLWQHLGLVIVDEEQRFGVSHKERLKRVCVDVDVLTLSATPIPRTLASALSGIRDCSELPSAPPGRGLTQTNIWADAPGNPEHEKRLALLIERELQRGGQCFYVVPYIADIDRAVSRVQDALRMISTIDREDQVLVAHGQIKNASDVITRLADDASKASVLVATTLIENGLDLPRVNTIIVQDAHRFGLATLHQLRGRVGRGRHNASCVLMHPRDLALTPAALARLRAMNDQMDGPQLARRDLEIRGAGTVLGTRQSGRGPGGILGPRLYAKILQDELDRIRSLELRSVPSCTYLLDADRFSSQEETAFQDAINDILANYAPINASAPLARLAPEAKGFPIRKRLLKRAYLCAHAARLGFDSISLAETTLSPSADTDLQDIIPPSVLVSAPHLTPITWNLLKKEVQSNLRTSLRFDEPRATVEVVRLGALPPGKRLDFLLTTFMSMTAFLDRVQHIISSSSSSNEDDEDPEEEDDLTS